MQNSKQISIASKLNWQPPNTDIQTFDSINSLANAKKHQTIYILDFEYPLNCQRLCQTINVQINNFNFAI